MLGVAGVAAPGAGLEVTKHQALLVEGGGTATRWRCRANSIAVLAAIFGGRPGAGVFLLFLILVLGDWVARIPTGALIAVMVSVAIGTFDWRTFRRMKKLPITETLVMVTTVTVVLVTHNLAVGVLVGVALSALFFARSVGKLLVVRPTRSLDGRRVYQIQGALFFVTVEDLLASIDLREDEPVVQLDLTGAHIWDESAVAAIDQVVLRFRARGVEVGLTGMNQASANIVDRLGTSDDPEATSASGHWRDESHLRLGSPSGAHLIVRHGRPFLPGAHHGLPCSANVEHTPGAGRTRGLGVLRKCAPVGAAARRVGRRSSHALHQ